MLRKILIAVVVLAAWAVSADAAPKTNEGDADLRECQPKRVS